MRLFIGLELSDEVRASLAEASEVWKTTARAHFHEPDRYHMTLAFLGDVDRERVPLLENTMRRVDWRPFAIESGAPGSFASGALYYGVREPCPGLYAAYRAVADALRADGWPYDDKPFRPHITVARQAKACGAPPLLTPWRQEVRYLTLFESARRDTPEGSRLFYTPIFRTEANKP